MRRGDLCLLHALPHLAEEAPPRVRVFPPEEEKIILAPEELVLRHEEVELARNLLPWAKGFLTRTQRAWLVDMLADIKWHGELKLSRVADQMERDPAQATRTRALANIRRALQGRVW